MNSLSELHVKIFADGADRATMLELYRNPLVKGFTTNPTMMRSAGVSGFEAFARGVLADIPDRPISFEVFGDQEDEMDRQARTIASWGANVYVKIPVTNTLGKSTAGLVRRLAADSIKVNVTAVMTLEQVSEMRGALGGPTPACISVFAGRIADTGVDPVPIMREAIRSSLTARTSNSSGRARAKCSTSFTPNPPAATSSPRRTTSLRSCPWSGKTSASTRSKR